MTSGPPTPPPRRKRSRHPRWRLRLRRAVWLAVGVAAILAAVAGLLKPRLDGWARREVERRVAAALDAEVRLGSLTLDFWNLGVDFRDLQIEARRDGERRLGVFVVAGRVGMDTVDLPGLYFGSLRLSELSLEQPFVDLSAAFLDERAGDGAARPLEVALDRLTVRGGRFRFEDAEIPLELDARAVRLDALWSPEYRALSGFGSLRLLLEREPLVRPLELDVESRFRWRDEALALFQTRATGSGLELSGSADVALSEGRRIEARALARADLARFTDWLPPDFPELAGDVRAEATLVEESGRGWRVEGDVRSGPTRFGPVEAASVEGRATVEPGTVRLALERVEAFDGTARGDVTVDLGATTGLDLDLTGTGLSAARIFAFLDLPVPLEGRVDAGLTLAGPAEDTGAWRGEGRFDVRPGDFAGRGLATRGVGTFALDAGAVTVRTGAVEISDTLLVAELDARFAGPSAGRSVLRLDGETRDARATQLGTLEILRAFDVAIPDPLRDPLEGRGPLSARIETGARTALDLTFDLADGAYRETAFESARLDLTLAGEALDVRELVVVSEDQRLRLSAAADVGAGRLDAVDAELDNVRIERWTRGVAAAEPFAGRLDGSVTLSREDPAAGLAGAGRLTWSAGSYGAVALDEVVADLEVAGDRVHVPLWTLRAPGVAGSGTAAVELASRTWSVEPERLELDLAELAAVRDAEIPAEGRLLLAGRLEGDASAPAGEAAPPAWAADLSLAGSDVSLWAQELDRVDGRLEGDAAELRLRLESGSGQGWALQGSAVPQDAFPSEARLSLDATPVAPGGVGMGDLEAFLSGEVRWSGPLTDPATGTLEAELPRAQIWLGSRSITNIDPLSFRYADGDLRLEPAKFEGPGGVLDVRAAYATASDVLDVSAEGRLSLALLAGVLPEARASGEATIDLDVRGPLAAPDLDGRIRVRQGRLRWLGLPQTLEQIDLLATFRPGALEVSRFGGSIGGGDIGGSGRVELDGLAPKAFRFELEGDAIRLRYPDDFEGIYGGDLAWTGDLASSVLSGTVRIERGLYAEEFELTELLGFGVREYSADDPVDLPDTIGLDVQIEAPDNVWVRNDLLRAESSVRLDVGGTLARPEVTGRIQVLEGGEIEFRNVEYRIESGSLDFLEIGRIDPYLTLRARTTVQGYDVLLTVEGTLDDFQYELTSNPTLSQQDIIALLTTGSTLQDLTAGRGGTGSGFTGDLAANYFADALTGRFQKQLESALGLERIEINPLLLEGETDPTTRITLGKEVADDLFVIVSSDLGRTERQLYQVEWRASRKLRVTVQHSSSTGGIGGNVEYTGRFWIRKPPATDAAAVAEEGAPGAGEGAEADEPERGRTVGELRWEGIDAERARALERRIPLKPGEPYRRSTMFESVDEIRRALIADGRIEAQVRATALRPETRGGPVPVEFRVDPGPRLDVRFEGVSRRERRKLRPILEEAWVDSLFELDLYSDSVRILREHLQERGYYAADVQMDLRLDAEPPEVVFRVDKGEPVAIEEVRIEGSGDVGEDRIRRQMLSRPSGLFGRKLLRPEVLRDDVAAIRNLYRDLGYLDVEIEEPQILLSTDGGTATVVLEIDPGPEHRVSTVEFAEYRPFDESSLQEWSGLEAGEVFSRGKLLEAESAIRAALDSRGFPDARVRGRFDAGDPEVEVRFELEPGRRLTVGEIRIEGNRKTHPKVIRRELQFAPGDRISRETVLRSQHRLYRLGIFSNVRIVYGPPEGAAGAADADGAREAEVGEAGETAAAEGTPQLVRVQVEEAPPLSFSASAGYDTEAGVRAGLGVTHANLFGRDRELGVQAFESGIEQRYQLVFREPRLFDERYPALFRVAYEDREEVGFDVIRQGLALRIDRKFDAVWSAFARYNLQEVDLANVDDALAVREEKLENLRLGDVGVAIVRDARDDPFLTRNGTYLSLETRLFTKPLLSQATFSKTVAQAAWYRTFANEQALASSLRLGVANPFNATTRVPLSERFFAGGDSTLRGFERDEVGPKEDGLPVGGEALFLFNQEYRFPIWRRLRGVVFYDAGNVFGRLEDLDPTDLRHVLGAGLRVETPIGPLRLEYGAKLDREPDESKGEFFVSIGAAF